MKPLWQDVCMLIFLLEDLMSSCVAAVSNMFADKNNFLSFLAVGEI